MLNNIDEMKSNGFRIARRINKALQRSNMNPKLKPFFTESSVAYRETGDKKGIVLNSVFIDNENTINKLSAKRFNNNLKLIKETVDNILDKEIMDVEYTLTESSNSNEVFRYGDDYKRKYTQCMLTFNETALPNTNINKVEIDDDKKHEMDMNYSDNSYYKEPDPEGESTFNDLSDEISLDKDDKVLADPLVGKTKVSNSPRNNDLQSEIECRNESLDFDKVLNFIESLGD